MKRARFTCKNWFSSMFCWKALQRIREFAGSVAVEMECLSVYMSKLIKPGGDGSIVGGVKAALYNEAFENLLEQLSGLEKINDLAQGLALQASSMKPVEIDEMLESLGDKFCQAVQQISMIRESVDLIDNQVEQSYDDALKLNGELQQTVARLNSMVAEVDGCVTLACSQILIEAKYRLAHHGEMLKDRQIDPSQIDYAGLRGSLGGVECQILLDNEEYFTAKTQIADILQKMSEALEKQADIDKLMAAMKAESASGVWHDLECSYGKLPDLFACADDHLMRAGCGFVVKRKAVRQALTEVLAAEKALAEISATQCRIAKRAADVMLAKEDMPMLLHFADIALERLRKRTDQLGLAKADTGLDSIEERFWLASTILQAGIGGGLIDVLQLSDLLREVEGLCLKASARLEYGGPPIVEEKAATR